MSAIIKLTTHDTLHGSVTATVARLCKLSGEFKHRLSQVTGSDNKEESVPAEHQKDSGQYTSSQLCLAVLLKILTQYQTWFPEATAGAGFDAQKLLSKASPHFKTGNPLRKACHKFSKPK